MATERQVNGVGLRASPPESVEEETLSEICGAIAGLSEDGYRQLKAWLAEHDWDRWDRQIERDSESGALDFISDEIREDKKKGLLKEI